MSGNSGRDRTEILNLYRKHVNKSLATLCDLIGAPLHARSAGTKIYDENGIEYLDCAGFGINLIGHRHPAVIAAVKRQLDEHPLVSRPLISTALPGAAAALAAVAPPGLDHVYLTNSGAEAVEVALKLARLQGKTRIIAMQGGFHGKTMGALSVTGREQYRTPFEPLVPGVEFAAFGDTDDLDRRLDHDGERTCVLVEPILGEGGVHFPPPGWLAHVRRRCTQVGAMLVIDEIQTGLGRVGSWWATDSEGVVPDVLLAGKILSGGVVPVGAVIATSDVFGPLDDDPMLHSSTFAGSPLAAAAVEATISVLQSEQLIERSAQLGPQVIEMVREAVAQHCPDLVREVRGRGLLIGIDFVTSDLAIEFLIALLERKVIPSYSLNKYHVLRLTPPATLDADDLSMLRSALFGAARELGGRRLLNGSARAHAPHPAIPTSEEIPCAS
ncbi:MAG TPA: aminotransferase class III-fold pyridoxal phosphate-dependent enzyme [Mycobacterium sp.]